MVLGHGVWGVIHSPSRGIRQVTDVLVTEETDDDGDIYLQSGILL